MVATAAADREEGVTVADDDGPVVTIDVVPPPEGGGGLKPNGLKNGFGEGAGAAIPPPPPSPVVVVTGVLDGCGGSCFRERATDSGRGTAGNGKLNPGSDFTTVPGDKPF